MSLGIKNKYNIKTKENNLSLGIGPSSSKSNIKTNLCLNYDNFTGLTDKYKQGIILKSDMKNVGFKLEFFTDEDDTTLKAEGKINLPRKDVSGSIGLSYESNNGVSKTDDNLLGFIEGYYKQDILKCGLRYETTIDGNKLNETTQDIDKQYNNNIIPFLEVDTYKHTGRAEYVLNNNVSVNNLGIEVETDEHFLVLDGHTNLL